MGPMAGSKVSFRLGAGGYNPYPVQDGHVLFAFSAADAQSTTQLQLSGISISDHPQVFSCELSQVD